MAAMYQCTFGGGRYRGSVRRWPAGLTDRERRGISGKTEHELTRLPDPELIAYAVRARDRGDRDEFVRAVTIFVWKRKPWIEYRVAVKIGNHEDGKDVVQDVLRSVFESAHRITGSHPGEFANWLKAITRNRIADFIVRRKRQREREQMVPPVLDEEDGYLPEIADLNDEYGAVDTNDVVEQALAGRSDAHRRAIELRMDGYPSREAAGILSGEDLPMSPANIDQVFSRFRKELRVEVDGTP